MRSFANISYITNCLKQDSAATTDTQYHSNVGARAEGWHIETSSGNK
jgi:hypothetical protein